ncbi:hypothetical protein E8E14_012862 [Neopestalotiopsis sp. 37M]|nr:hypothetical protein E8E14_012862 [Neopestalotiopsis sp. 37M]
MSARFNYEMQGEALKSYDDCSEDLKNHMRRAFNLWAAQCGQEVELQTEEELKASVNDLVFRKWDSSQLLKRAPKLGSPKFTDNTIRIGRFKKDLPDPKMGRNPWEIDDREAALFAMFGLASDYKVPPERKAGQPALVRARLDVSTCSIIHDYVDSKGRWVPTSYIDFRTPNQKPDNRTIGEAYSMADTTWANIFDAWNKDLCVYLCRCRLFDASHPSTPWNPILERETRVLTEAHFLQAPCIRTSADKIRAQLKKALDIVEGKPQPVGIYTVGHFRFKQNNSSSNKE